MGLIQAIFVIAAITFNIILPQYKSNSNRQVLGESTASQSANNVLPRPSLNPTQAFERSELIKEVKGVLGCDYETTCNIFCLKPVNKQKCEEFINEKNKRKSREIGTNFPTPFVAQLDSLRNEPKKSESELLKEKENYLKNIIARHNDLKSAISSPEASLNAGEKLKKQQEKEKFKAHLQDIKNINKRLIVKKMDEKIVEINIKAVERMSGVLEKLYSALAAISQRIIAVKSHGGDTTIVDSAVVDAHATLLDAQKAVLLQTSKTYTIEISTNEAKLKESVGLTISTLSKDLNVMHQAVNRAREEIVSLHTDSISIKPPTQIVPLPITSIVTPTP